MEITRQETITLKANSFSGRYGGVGTDFKLYFDDLRELKTGIDAVIEGKRYLAQKLSMSEELNIKPSKPITKEDIDKYDIGNIED